MQPESLLNVTNVFRRGAIAALGVLLKAKLHVELGALLKKMGR
jgi:hypothetical protein